MVGGFSHQMCDDHLRCEDDRCQVILSSAFAQLLLSKAFTEDCSCLLYGGFHAAILVSTCYPFS